MAERQIITTIHLAHNPVFLAFHPSAKQIAIVCFDSRERNDYVVFAWQPDAVAAEGDLAFEDADPTTERAKREQEREAYRALLARQQQAGEGGAAQEEGWQIRTDIRLGEKNYRVSELNGAMFGPCGTRMYAGNHDGRLNVWEYPIKRVVLEENRPEEEKKEDEVGKMEEDDQEDDDDAPIRRSNENRGGDETVETDKPQVPAEEDANMDAENASPNAEDDGKEVKEEQALQEAKVDSEMQEGQTNPEMQEGQANPEMQEGQVDSEMPDGKKGAEPQDGKEESKMTAEQQPKDVSQPTIKDEDVQMTDAEGANEVTESAKPELGSSTEVKTDVPATDSAAPAEASGPTETPDTTAPVSKASSPVSAPPIEPAAPPAQMLKYLYGQVVNSGCLNCIDFDPRRRYIATGGSEGMVNLCQVGEWIGVASFDSYT